MSDGHPYDAAGEDSAIRAELANLVEHQARQDGRINSIEGRGLSLLDRFAVAMGRVAALESQQRRLVSMTEALCRAHGVEVPG